MKKADPDLPKLTKNDKEVLRNIIMQARSPDTEIARKMNLSQQAVFKIRQKLENMDIIQGYVPVINYRKIGVNLLTIITVKVAEKIWQELSEEQVSEKIRKIPNIIAAYRLPEPDITHILILGFKDIAQKDRFLMKLQTKYCNEIKIKHIYPFSVDRIITQNPVSVLFQIIEDISLTSLFLNNN